MEGFGAGLACGMGCGIVIGMASGAANCQTAISKKLKQLVTEGNIKIADSRGNEITPDQLIVILKTKKN